VTNEQQNDRQENQQTEPEQKQRNWHRVAIGLGSNLGDSQTILNAALQVLAETPTICVKAKSPVYQTVAIGPPQPDYLNQCAVLVTSLEPQALLTHLLAVEAQFGRVRRERWGPRLLDIDLLLFDDRIFQQPGLEIPHPRMAERAFVLVPLRDIAPDWIEPCSGQTIADLVQQVDCSGVHRINDEL
jgi:2-amino-4-hydroxy-6-hydroxymethyldihydropteridine diphosphokinase